MLLLLASESKKPIYLLQSQPKPITCWRVCIYLLESKTAQNHHKGDRERLASPGGGIPPEMRTKHGIQVPKLREDYARTQDLDIANSVFRSRKGAPKFCLLESTLGRPHKGAL